MEAEATMTATDVPPIRKTPGKCGGRACVRDLRMPVWLLILKRLSGETDDAVLASYPGLTADDLAAAWDYYRTNPIEIDRDIWHNDTAANVPDGDPVPAAVIVAGIRLGLAEEEIRRAFDPPLPPDAVSAAWREYGTTPTLGIWSTTSQLVGR